MSFCILIFMNSAEFGCHTLYLFISISIYSIRFLSLNTLPQIEILKGVSLKPYNTFQLDASAAFWVEIHQPDDVLKLLDTPVFHRETRYVLGGGSNVLFAQDYSGLIIKNSIPGIEVLSEDDRHVVLRAGAGVVWDDLVKYTVDRGWGGLENLSMIPGQTGAAPIQNIGAYGVELMSTFVSLDAINLESGIPESFDREMCRFGYRDSIFKTTHKGTYLITHVTLNLTKSPELNLDYGNIREVLASEGVTKPGIRDVSMAVRKIRASKLPDPAVTGNAGSFFKNPVISAEQFDSLRSIHSDIPSYPSGSRIKIPAAWLIDQCGFRGKRVGDSGVHERHALILVNHGEATGLEVIGLAANIQQEVSERFGVTLEPEVNIVGDNPLADGAGSDN